MPAQSVRLSITIASIGGGGASAPAAPADGNWSLASAASPSGDRIEVNITTATSGCTHYELVDQGDAAVYRLPGKGTGKRVIPLPTGKWSTNGARSWKLRAVNGTAAGPLNTTAKSVTPAKMARATTSVVSSYTFADTYGGYVPFSVAVPVAQVDGHLAILMDRSSSLVAGLLPALTASATYTDAGGVTSTGRRNGMMRNLYLGAGSTNIGRQGLDAAGGVGPFAGAGYQQSTFIPFDDTLLEHPDKAAIAFTAATPAFALVQGYAHPADPLTVRCCLSYHRCFHFIKEAPPVGWVPPSTIDADQEVLVADGEIDVARLPKLPLHSQSPSLAEALGLNHAEAEAGSGGDPWSRLSTSEHNGINPYGVDAGVQYCEVYEFLISNNPDSEKQQLIRNVAIRATNYVKWAKRHPEGIFGGHGAGYHRTRGLDCLMMLLATGNTLWLDAMRVGRSNMLTGVRKVAAANVDSPINNRFSQSGSGSFEAPYNVRDIGDYHYSAGGHGSAADTGYYAVNMAMQALEAAIIAHVTFCGTSIYELLTEHDGPLALKMKGMKVVPLVMKSHTKHGAPSRNITARQLTPWTAWSGSFNLPPAGQRPQRHYWTWLGSNQLTSRMVPIAGGLRFDLADIAVATGSVDPITAAEVFLSHTGVAKLIKRYPIAGFNWLPEITEYQPGVPLNEMEHYGSFRLENAYGIADWTDPHRRSNSARLPRMSGTVAATAAANRAPVSVIAPDLYVARAPVTEKDWEKLSDVPAERILTELGTYYADGMVAMKPYSKPTFGRERANPTAGTPETQNLGSLVWGTVDLAAVADKADVGASLKPDDLGKWHRIVSTANNGVGGVLEQRSQPFYIPAAPVRPANHPYALRFGPMEHLHYPAVYDSIIVRNATKLLSTLLSFEDTSKSTEEETVLMPFSPGGLIASKTGPRPEIEMAFDLAAGTWRCVAGLPVGLYTAGSTDKLYSNWSAGGAFHLRTATALGGTSYLSGSRDSEPITRNVANIPYARTVDETITVGTGGARVYLYVRIGSTSPGAGGGSPMIADIDWYKLA